jgi:hypothetical protein
VLAGSKRIDELRVGDLVPAWNFATGQVEHTPLLGFIDAMRKHNSTMHEIIPHQSAPIVASPRHLVFVSKDAHSQPVAQQVKRVVPGDYVWIARNGTMVATVVRAVNEVSVTGAYGPLTALGNIIVNDALFSVYSGEPLDHNHKHRVYALYRAWLTLFPDTPGRLPGDFELVWFSSMVSSNLFSLRDAVKSVVARAGGLSAMW